METQNLDAGPQPQRPGRAGRAVRAAVGLALFSIMIVGNTWGTDDEFPFGPFRMYLPPNRAEQPVDDTRVVANNAAGEWLYLDQSNTGFRRAEMEGQLERFRREPELLAALAEAYERRMPHRPDITRITVVVRWWEVEDARSTGEYTDRTIVVWPSDGAPR